MLVVFIISLIFFGIVAFAASETGGRFFDKLNEEQLDRELKKHDKDFRG